MPKFSAPTRENLADQYGVTVRTLYRWLKERQVPVPKRNRITPLDLERIYEALGDPNHVRKRPEISDYAYKKGQNFAPSNHR